MPAENDSTAANQASEGDTREQAVRRRAYDISESEDAGTAEQNWERAEREIDAEG
jgi:hypothetical protein